jgi:hypothetical protein
VAVLVLRGQRTACFTCGHRGCLPAQHLAYLLLGDPADAYCPGQLPFFTEDEIEFDLDPRQILNASDLDAVCAFVQAVGRALRRPVHVCQEGGPPWPQDDLRYDPIADEVVALP